MAAAGAAFGSPSSLSPTRSRHMNITNILNEEEPPRKLQRTSTAKDVWGSGNRSAVSAAEGCYAASAEPMGPPTVNKIRDLLNEPEPERSASEKEKERVKEKDKEREKEWEKGWEKEKEKEKEKETEKEKEKERKNAAGSTRIKCATCGEFFTCDSLLRKHQAKHTKPFKCKQKGCERQLSGFTSPNDLKRHENSVHKGTKGPAIGFNCIYDHCRDRNKVYFRLDNFRNHLKKLHTTHSVSGMSAFLKHAESECRVEVNPDDTSQGGSASESSGPRRRFSQRKAPKDLQWVVTKVDNGNLARPRPAYYGPLDDESSDSAMDMDRSDMETTSPPPSKRPVTAPTQQTAFPAPSRPAPLPPSAALIEFPPAAQPRLHAAPAEMPEGRALTQPEDYGLEPTPQDQNGDWVLTSPERREAEQARMKQMAEIMTQMREMKSKLEYLQGEYNKLEAQEAQCTNEILTNGLPPSALLPWGGDRSHIYETRSPLNTRALERCPVSNNETISRFVKQSLTDDPAFVYAFAPRMDGSTIGNVEKRTAHDSNQDAASSLLSPPETVASPPRDAPPGSGPSTTAQDVQRPRTQSVHYPPRAIVPHLSQPPVPRLGRPVNELTVAIPAPRPAPHGPPEKAFRCGHPGCKSTFARNCELRKHRKRHTRPYGCTARYCQKQFGSKNDWKRHENSQHHRLESWKCTVPVAPYGPTDTCQATHFRKENFVNHLKSNAHNIKAEVAIKAWAEKSYIGGSDHHIFWCGFCTDEKGQPGVTVRLKSQGLTGWDERFDHLGSHFESGCSIRNYKYQDEDGIDCPSVSDSEDDDSPEPPESPLHQLAYASVIHSTTGNMDDPEDMSPLHATKVDVVQSGGPSRTEKLAWYCCRCVKAKGNSHVSLVDLHARCLSCEHETCPACKRQLIDAVLDAEHTEAPAAGGYPPSKQRQ